MPKKKTFMDDPKWDQIVRNIQGIYTSDGSMATILDFERCLDDSDIYSFKNWEDGELVEGPILTKYSVTCTFMWPEAKLPDRRACRRLINMGCTVQHKKTKIKIPIEVESQNDLDGGTNYPKLISTEVLLVKISVPRELMDEIKEGSIELADQTIDLEDLEDAYARDYDKAETKASQESQDQMGGFGGMMPGI